MGYQSNPQNETLPTLYVVMGSHGSGKSDIMAEVANTLPLSGVVKVKTGRSRTADTYSPKVETFSYVTLEQFAEMETNGLFATTYNYQHENPEHRYGITLDSIRKPLSEGKSVAVIVNLEGSENLDKPMEGLGIPHMIKRVVIYAPPEDVRYRLVGRPESEKQKRERISNVRAELNAYFRASSPESGHIDFMFNNPNPPMDDILDHAAVSLAEDRLMIGRIARRFIEAVSAGVTATTHGEYMYSMIEKLTEIEADKVIDKIRKGHSVRLKYDERGMKEIEDSKQVLSKDKRALHESMPNQIIGIAQGWGRYVLFVNRGKSSSIALGDLSEGDSHFLGSDKYFTLAVLEKMLGTAKEINPAVMDMPYSVFGYALAHGLTTDDLLAVSAFDYYDPPPQDIEPRILVIASANTQKDDIIRTSALTDAQRNFFFAQHLSSAIRLSNPDNPKAQLLETMVG